MDSNASIISCLPPSALWMMAPNAQLQPTGQLICFGLPDGTGLDLEVLRECGDPSGLLKGWVTDGL